MTQILITKLGNLFGHPLGKRTSSTGTLIMSVDTNVPCMQLALEAGCTAKHKQAGGGRTTRLGAEGGGLFAVLLVHCAWMLAGAVCKAHQMLLQAKGKGDRPRMLFDDSIDRHHDPSIHILSSVVCSFLTMTFWLTTGTCTELCL